MCQGVESDGEVPTRPTVSTKVGHHKLRRGRRGRENRCGAQTKGLPKVVVRDNTRQVRGRRCDSNGANRISADVRTRLDLQRSKRFLYQRMSASHVRSEDQPAVSLQTHMMIIFGHFAVKGTGTNLECPSCRCPSTILAQLYLVHVLAMSWCGAYHPASDVRDNRIVTDIRKRLI